jgi:hypothetical protein
VISFAIFTKWWYTLPTDAPDTMFTGFPFPFVCHGWHTSMSLQIFIAEFVVDLLSYFLFWWVVVFCIYRFVVNIKLHKLVTIILWTLTGLVIGGSGLIASNKDNLFYLKRPFNIEVMTTGYQFIWQRIERPDYYKYHPADKHE